MDSNGSNCSLFVNAVSVVTATLLAFAAVAKWYEAIDMPHTIVGSLGQLLLLFFLPPIEFTVSLWLFSGQFRKQALAISMTLFASFIVGSGISWFRGLESCGCFGAVQISPLVVLLMDTLTFSGLFLAWANQTTKKADFCFRNFTIRVCILLAFSASISAGLIGRTYLMTESIAFGNETKKEKIVRFDRHRLPELPALLPHFEPDPVKFSIARAVPAKLVFVFYRNDCQRCSVLLESIRKLEAFSTYKFVLCDVSESPSHLNNQAKSDGNHTKLRTIPLIRWAIPTPACLFYSFGKPIDFQINIENLEQIQWPNE